MTVNSTTNRVAYIGNGTANPLAVAFPFQMQEDLVVVQTVIASGLQTTLVLNSDYTITGTPDDNGFYSNGGSVVPAASFASTIMWTIYRDPPITQLVEHVDNDPVPASSLDNPTDKLTMIAQRLKDRLGYAIVAPDGDPVQSMAIPSVPGRNGFLMAFDPATGQPIISGSTAAQVDALVQANSVNGLSGALGAVATTATLLALFAAPVSLGGNTTFVTGGRTTVGDGGGGVFYYDASDTTTADNGGTVRVDGVGRRWKYAGSFVSVKLFGGLFDGSTNDTAAIVAAWTAVYNAGGGNLYMPPGVGKVSTLPLHWSAAVSVRMKGCGQAITVLSKIGTDTDPLLDISADVGVLDVYSEFSDFSIVGNGKHADGIRATTITSCSTRNIKITACDVGFHAKGAIAWQHYNYAWNSNNKGYLQEKSSGIYPNQNQFFGGSVKSNSQAGVDLVHGTTFFFYGLDAEDNGTVADAATSQIFIRSTISDETSTAVGGFVNVDLESARSKNIEVQGSSGLRLSFKGVNSSGSGASHNIMTVGAIASVSLDEFVAASPSDMVTLAATASSIRNSVVTTTDTSTSREYINVTNSAGLVRRGSAGCGVATLVGGTKAVAHTAIQNGDIVIVTNNQSGGTPGRLSVARSAGVGFTINSDSGTDTSIVGWQVVTPV